MFSIFVVKAVTTLFSLKSLICVTKYESKLANWDGSPDEQSDYMAPSVLLIQYLSISNNWWQNDQIVSVLCFGVLGGPAFSYPYTLFHLCTITAVFLQYPTPIIMRYIWFTPLPSHSPPVVKPTQLSTRTESVGTASRSESYYPLF